MALINCPECKKLISDKAKMCLGCGAPGEFRIVTDIVGTPIKIGNLEVAQHDFNRDRRYDDAKVACAKLGEGWRLPTKDELNLLYQNKDKIGGFSAAVSYWSSTEYNIEYHNGYDAWAQDFDDGMQDAFNKKSKYFVRAVRAF